MPLYFLINITRMSFCKVPSIFDNAQAVVISHLIQMHETELTASRGRVDAAYRKLTELHELCHSAGMFPEKCDGCCATCFLQDLLSCGECATTRCLECNNDWIILEGDEALCSDCYNMAACGACLAKHVSKGLKLCEHCGEFRCSDCNDCDCTESMLPTNTCGERAGLMHRVRLREPESRGAPIV